MDKENDAIFTEDDHELLTAAYLCGQASNRAELRELRKDKARLDYLLDCVSYPAHDDTVYWITEKFVGKTVREAIDKAMAKEND